MNDYEKLETIFDQQIPQRSDYAWKSEIIGHDVFKPMGKMTSPIPCYLDTCVLLDAFLENADKYEDEKDKRKADNLRAAKKLFEGEYGPFVILTSPFVLAEFNYKAIRVFNRTDDEAKKLIEDLFSKYHFRLCVPKIRLNGAPQLHFPFANYSCKLEGQQLIDGKFYDISMKFHEGGSIIESVGGDINEQKFHNLLPSINFNNIILSSALYNLFISASSGVADEVLDKVGIQDLLCLSFSRGTAYELVHFVTSDVKLINSLHGKRPFHDLEAVETSVYLKNLENMKYLLKP